MLQDRLTLFVIPEKNGHVRRVDFSPLMLQLFIVVVGFFVIASLAMVVDYVYIYRNSQTQADLARSLKLQKFQLRNINNLLDESLLDLVKYEDFDRKLRVISDLQDPPPLARFEELTLGEVTEGTGRTIASKLNQLAYAIKSREISFFQLEAFLQEQQDRLARTPSVSPVKGHLSSKFGTRTDPFTGRVKFHKGIDISNGPFTPLYAPADGVVINTFQNGGFGEFLVIDHGYDVVTRYGHLAKYEVKVGQRVKRGQLIARMGSTGRSTATHLHYEVLVRDQHVDPQKYILDF